METTQEQFARMTPEERSMHCAISYTEASVSLHFGTLPSKGITLTPEQIGQLTAGWQERFAKAQNEAAVTGCTLLAGENTDVVTTGSLYWCKQHIGELPYKKLRRDPYSGKGCWAIVRGDATLAEGYFDKDAAW